MSTSTPTPVPPEKPKRIGFYRDYLTPTLHRRFTRAAGVTLLLCYIEAVFIGDASSFFWMFFPLGKAGVRTLLLFISVLVIFILRVGQLHIGERTATSPFNNFLQSFFALSTLQIFAFYSFSAWWFSEVYMWSAPEHADLSWIIDGGPMERDRLNERPILLRTTFLVHGIAQSLLHLYFDYGRVKPRLSPLSSFKDELLRYTSVRQILKQEYPKKLLFDLICAFTITFAAYLLYGIFLRQTVWQWSLWFARLVSNISRSSEPSEIPTLHITLLMRGIWTNILLMLLWNLSNIAFNTYVGLPPMKRGRPLTSDARDPNATLLNGLRSRKNFVKTFAFWELDMISSSDELRRKTIYAEYDRKDGSTWSQILTACLHVIDDINTRLIDSQTPPPELTVKSKTDNAVVSLPRLSAPLKVDPIFESSPRPMNGRERVESGVGSFAKSIGQSPLKGPGVLRKGVKLARDRVLTPEHQQALQPDNIESATKSAVSWALDSRFGFIFQQTFDRRAAAKVLGTPRSELELISYAVDSVARLAVTAIKEDSMGLVNKDIALIMRTLGNIITQVKKSMRESPIHWTDVKFKPDQGNTRHVQEIDRLLDQLQKALKQIIEGYGKFARDMSLSAEEMRAARMAAGLVTT